MAVQTRLFLILSEETAYNLKYIPIWEFNSILYCQFGLTCPGFKHCLLFHCLQLDVCLFFCCLPLDDYSLCLVVVHYPSPTHRFFLAFVQI